MGLIFRSCSAVVHCGYALDLRQFVVDAPEQMRGRVAPEELPAGSYRCTVTCRLSSGQSCTVRDFAFEK